MATPVLFVFLVLVVCISLSIKLCALLMMSLFFGLVLSVVRFLFMRNNMKIAVDCFRLNFLVESRQDSQGKTMYYITTSLGRIRFRNPESLSDFIANNKDIGYVE